MPKYDVLVADLDGTIIDSRLIMQNAFKDLCEEAGITHISGATFALLLRSPLEALKQIGIKDTTEYWIKYEQHIGRAQVYSGLKRVIRTIRDNYIKIGIVTSLPARRANRLIDAVSLSEFISCVVGWQRNVPRKPNPNQVIKAVEALGDPRRVLYIGDSPLDIEAGRRASVVTGFVTWGYYSINDLILQPDHVISNPKQLLEFYR